MFKDMEKGGRQKAKHETRVVINVPVARSVIGDCDADRSIRYITVIGKLLRCDVSTCAGCNGRFRNDDGQTLMISWLNYKENYKKCAIIIIAKTLVKIYTHLS